ncbi:MAG: pyrroloquinoline quinone biosynthesis peptide chaperone PqqD [Pikeienuella sp.]
MSNEPLVTLAADSIPQIPRGVRLHHDKVRDGWVLLAPERAIKLDAIGLAILREIDGDRTFSAIVERLATQFNAQPEQISNDVSEFVTALANRRILEVI